MPFSQDGIVCAGRPVGTEEFCRRQMEKGLEKAELAIAAVNKLHKKSSKLLLLRECVSEKLSHLFRAVLPQIALPFALRLEEMLRVEIAKILEIDLGDLPDHVLQRFLLPIREGGLGFHSMEPRVHAAFVAGWAELAHCAKQKQIP